MDNQEFHILTKELFDKIEEFLFSEDKANGTVISYKLLEIVEKYMESGEDYDIPENSFK